MTGGPEPVDLTVVDTLNQPWQDFPVPAISVGSFVWFPEGGTMEYGATDDADCTFLFIRHKAFDIHHVDSGHG